MFKSVPKENVGAVGSKKRFLRSYNKPNLVRLGSIADITSGHDGSKPDATGPTSPPTKS